MIIHQELALIPELTIAENMFLGNERKTALGYIDWAETYRMAGEEMKRVGLKEHPEVLIKDIGTGKQHSMTATIETMDNSCRSYGSRITGREFIKGREVHLRNEKDAIRSGLAYVTEDRKTNSLVLSDTIARNTTMARLEKVTGLFNVVDVGKETEAAEDYVRAMRTKTPSIKQDVGNLSGGNQQKVLLSKWMFAEPDVLILDEPSRGIDVGAKYEIYCIINDMVAQGKAVIMISSELPELLGMSERIYIMNDGRIVSELETYLQELHCVSRRPQRLRS